MVLGCAYRIIPNWDSSWKTYPFSSSGGYIVGDSNLLCCSSALLDYIDVLSSMEFSFDLSALQTVSYTLRPIVEEQNITPIDIFGEIFGILPVLVVVLIGFIGIRKGIKFLFELLRSS